MSEVYTPGYSRQALAFTLRRRLDPRGAFFLSHLNPRVCVLDYGCGPGSICDIARRVAPGAVIGLDANAGRLTLAARRAAELRIHNVSVRRGSVYELPFEDASFDAVFSQALLEHLSQPRQAVKEFLRGLKPGGALGVCTPD